MNKEVGAPSFLGVHVLFGLKAFDLPADPAAEFTGIKTRDGSNAALPLQNRFPILFVSCTDGREQTDTCDHNSATRGSPW